MTDIDDRIYRARLLGVSPRTIADQFNITVADVNAAVDRKMIKVDNACRIRMTALDLERLEQLTERCLEAIAKGSLAAGHLLLKVMERRAHMLGTDAPMRIDPIELIEVERPESSTDNLRRVFEEMRREQQLAPPSCPN